MDKKLLKQYEHLKAEAKELARMVTCLEWEIKSQPSAERQQHLEELKARYNHFQSQTIKQATKIEVAIENLTDPLQRRILRHRYLEGRSWNYISQITNYSTAQLHRLHDQALS